eukprot:TRINITY_DN6998_c0_g1_i16.p1 TRINITY_DN6998_c0_g1~~TRINITY_DN6998_c0_g1_i16.p1  ORF type:complete len:111 (-),score=51.62 TRINITY_DN6998_c0_g1_i16:380-688(-)
MIRRPPRSTHCISSAASDVYKRQMYDDQFDYHYYALKKGNINAYLQMIKWEDNLYSHKYFMPSALGLLRCYLKAHKIAEKSDKAEEEAKELEEMKVRVEKEE